MDGRKDGWMHGLWVDGMLVLDGWMDGWMNGWMYEWIRWMYEWMDVRMGEYKNGWVDKRKRM